LTRIAEGGKAEGPTAAEAVAHELATLILGQLSPGEKLPSEAELAARYGVSRLTMREAVKMVAGRGLLEVSRGRRAVVREPNGAVFSDFLTAIVQYDAKGLFDLVELRLSLEVQSATLAAKRASRPAIAAIEAALQGMRVAEEELRSGRDPAGSELRFQGYDMGFHEAVALASGNRILVYLFEAMADPLQESFFISRRGNELRGHTLADTIAAHQRILDAITQGSPRKAGEAMRVHLENTEGDIRAALSLLSATPSARTAT